MRRPSPFREWAGSMISRSAHRPQPTLFFLHHLGLIVLLTLMACRGIARADSDHNRARELKEAGEILPLEQVIETAKKERPGRLLEAELKKKEGRFIYELELLDEEGIVWELKYDAKSGALLKSKQDRDR